MKLLDNVETFRGQPLYRNIVFFRMHKYLLGSVPRKSTHGGAWREQEPSLSREPQKLKGAHHQVIDRAMKATRKELPLGLIRVWKEGITRDAGGRRFIKVVHGT